MVRAVAALCLIVLSAGCAETFGPTVTRYQELESRFYVRHIPLYHGEAAVNEIAADICGRQGRNAELLRAELFTPWPLDIRTATYDCVGG